MENLGNLDERVEGWEIGLRDQLDSSPEINAYPRSFSRLFLCQAKLGEVFSDVRTHDSFQVPDGFRFHDGRYYKRERPS